ncbi:MAG TPA: hypothetical protein VD969_22145 [Symbiobacteriaceae bacterium]|nr:hypothetical protein [Symbiobacteriaceae bacterium]
MDEAQELLRTVLSRLEELSADVKGLRKEMGEVKGELAGLRVELKGEIADLRSELKGEIAGLRKELSERLFDVEVDVDLMKKRYLEQEREIEKLKRRQA